MTCSICGSESHFRARCPQGQQNRGTNTGNVPSFQVHSHYVGPSSGSQASTRGPLDGLESEINEGQTPHLVLNSYMVADDTSSNQDRPVADSDGWSETDPWSNSSLPTQEAPPNDGAQWANYRPTSDDQWDGQEAWQWTHPFDNHPFVDSD